MRSTINSISLMVFSERVHQLFVKDMATTRYGHAKEVFPKSVPCSKAYNKVLSSGEKVSSDDSMMVKDDIADGLKLMDHG
ncbi:hypothetical protein Gohar_013494 [Gossypium harknessii]|uniref:Uncharacterized protein n=1 Tax=Gossypium harknessii TaxID=34285 RepID=A0A7J9H0Z0_9ROSI|nr:hypothetical protein [Gossypium harknessii]